MKDEFSSIGEIVKILKGSKAPEVFDKPKPGAYPYLQIEDLRPDATPKFAIDKDGTLATKTDVLIAWDGANAGTIGFDLEGYIGSTIAILRPTRDDIHAPYLGYFLRSKFEDIQENTTGATIPHVSRDYLENLKLPLPPLTEQKRIASLLARADRLRQLRRTAHDLGDALLQSVFLEMFVANGKKFDEQTIEDVASSKKYSLSSGPFGSNLTSEHYVDNGVIILRGLNISNGKVDLSNIKYISEQKAKELIRSEVHPGDIVVVAVGSSGLACLIPESMPRAIMSQNFNKITPDTRKINPVYFEYCLNSEIVQSQLNREITDTVRTFLSLTKLVSVKIPVPPLSLQEEFAGVVARVESLRGRMGESARQVEGLFESLLAESFGGIK